jgi:hypothetical protein
MKITTAIVSLFIFAAAWLRSINAEEPAKQTDPMSDCPMHAQHAAGVDQRGDTGMGFSHIKTTHHFRITPEGGAIEVTANDPGDATSREQIRQHLSHIAKMFGEGNFQIPMFVHDTVPPGTAVMQRLKSKITYRYEKSPTGGRVMITSDDPEALTAIHDFLRFQITEHRTGDRISGS